MAGYTYTKINWENEPSYNTPINENNLNHMDQGIFDLAYVKAEKNDAVFVNSISLDRKAGTTVGLDSVAAGYDTEATGPSSVAIGTNTSAKNGQAVAGGYNSKALGNTSLALGTHCITRLNAAESQAIGNNCIAGSANQMVFGQYNVEDTTGIYAEIVGNGSSGNESNARTLDWQGNETIAGDFTNGNGETLHGIYEALPVDTESGNPAVITDAFGGACKSLKLTLEPVQSGSGTPSPQNVRPISGRTQSVVTRTGKNLTNWKVNTTSSPLSIALPTGSYIISVNGTLASGNWYIRMSSGNGNYPYTVTDAGLSGWTKASSGWFYGGENVQSVPFTVPNGCTLVEIGKLNADGTISAQLEVGSTATTYEPYNGESITRTYGTTIYGGTDDVTGDGVTSTYEYVEYDGSNDENWNYGASTGLNQFYIQDTGIKYSTLNIACNRLKTIALQDRANNYNTIYAGTNVDSININMETITSVEAWRSWLSANPLQVAYEVATPTSIPLTSQNLPLLKGDNVITTDADSIDVEYSADIALYIAKKIAEGSQNNRSLSKGGLSESTEEETKEEKEEAEIEEPKKEETR